MAIITRDGIAAAIKQKILLNKTASITSVANIPFCTFDQAGNPGAGTLSAGNTANGIVPTDATAGYPTINAFSGSNTGYLARLRGQNTVASWIDLYDRVFSAGAYSFNANTTLASQPSYSGRVPNSNYTDCELWFEAVTAFTGNPTLTVTYTNQAGTAGRSTGAIAFGLAPIKGRCIRLPLQAGDTGIQKIESVVMTVATVGTFNINVMRLLASGRVPIANGGFVQKWDELMMPIVFADSAIMPLITADSTATGTPTIDFDIING